MPVINTSITFTDIAIAEGADQYFVANTGLPPVYQGQEWRIDVDFIAEAEEGEVDTFSVVGVFYSGNSAFVDSTTTDSVTLTPGNDPFDSTFTFIDFVNGHYTTYEKEVNEARTDGFSALTRWDPPPQPVLNFTHTFVVTVQNNTTRANTNIQIVETSNIYFEFPPYTQLVVDLVSKGSF